MINDLPSCHFVSVLLGIGMIAFSPSTSSAQETDPLRAFGGRIHDHWEGESVDSILSMLSPAGVDLSLGRISGSGLRLQQAEAILEELFDQYADSAADLDRAIMTSRDTNLGFVELSWTTVAEGTSEPLRFSVFFGCSLGEEGWTIYQITLMERARSQIRSIVP